MEECKRKLPMDLILATQTMSADYVQDRLVRQTALMQARCLVSQVEMALGAEFDLWKLPSCVIVRRLSQTEKRVQLPWSGEYLVIDTATGDNFIQLPLQAWLQPASAGKLPRYRIVLAFS